jgi:hypothetical protein
MTARSNGPVSFRNGRLVFGDAVSRVAESLSPLGAAARIVAEASACAVHLRELKVEGRIAEGQFEIERAKLEQRQREASQVLRQMTREVGRSDAGAREWRRMLLDVHREIVKPNLPVTQKKILLAAVRDYGSILVQTHASDNETSASKVDAVLNGEGAVGRTLTRSTGEPERTHGVRSRRSRRPGR